MTCKHQHLIRIPHFPGDALVCRDCGEHHIANNLCTDFDGLRDYYVPGEPAWSKRVQLAKLKWLTDGDLDGELEQCPVCFFAGTLDDFDTMGADPDCLFCNQCGAHFEQGPPTKPVELQPALFS